MSIRSWLSVAAVCVFVSVAEAQVPPVPVTDQVALLKSGDATAQRNKRIVFDFWRIVYEGRPCRPSHPGTWPRPTSNTTQNMASGRETLAAVLQEDQAATAGHRPHQGAGDLHHRRSRRG